MGLLSIFQRRAEGGEAAEPTADAVAAARAQARQRLIGAALLLGAALVVFPLLFESKPRPPGAEPTIELPRQPASAPAKALPAPPPGPAAAASAAAAPAEIVERAEDQGREVAPPAAAQAPADAPPPPAKPASAEHPRRSAEAAQAEAEAARQRTQAQAKAKAKAAADAEAARAQALLDSASDEATPPAATAASAAPSARVVVQVGAYTDADKLREARRRVEKLGFKTYTQVVQVDGSARTRVRIGPFASKAEADRAAARVKAAGLPVAILAL